MLTIANDVFKSVWLFQTNNLCFTRIQSVSQRSLVSSQIKAALKFCVGLTCFFFYCFSIFYDSDTKRKKTIYAQGLIGLIFLNLLCFWSSCPIAEM